MCHLFLIHYKRKDSLDTPSFQLTQSVKTKNGTGHGSRTSGKKLACTTSDPEQYVFAKSIQVYVDWFMVSIVALSQIAARHPVWGAVPMSLPWYSV